jgi:hypothetical protein
MDILMKTIVLLGLLAAPGVLHAADVADPVKEIMDATVSNWSGADTEWINIFDAAKIDQRFSRDFVAKYHEAEKHPATEDGISPFDYDVVVNGQDACPLKDISITPEPPADGKREVVVRFRKMDCADGPEAQEVSTVRFELIDEGGKPVIDDIVNEDSETKEPTSLKAIMTDIINGR